MCIGQKLVEWLAIISKTIVFNVNLCQINVKEVTEALNDIKDLLAFHQNVSVAMGTALQHLADSLFVNLANLILLRRDSYLEHVKPGIKPDTWNLLRNAPMFGYGLFPDSVLNTAEQDINKHKSAGVAPGPGPGASQCSKWRGSFGYRPYERRDTHRSSGQTEQDLQPWHQFSRNRSRGWGRGRASNPRFSKSRGLKWQLQCFSTRLNLSRQTLDSIVKKVNQTVGFVVPSSVSVSPQEQTLITQDYKKAVSYLDVVSHVPTVTFHGQPQKKGLSPGQCLNKIKLVKGVSCVSQCFSAPSVPNAPHVATEISVGGKIQSFWQVWQNLGSNPRVVSILKEGLLSALQRKATSQQVSLDCKQVCKPTEKQVFRRNFGLPNSKASCRKSGCQVFTGLLQPALSCSKAQQKWRPILDLSKLNLFLGTLEMETPESIRLSLQKGEWVTSLDFSDAYFHIPTNQRSRKCPKVSNQQSNLPVHLSSFWFGNGPVGVHQGSQR